MQSMLSTTWQSSTTTNVNPAVSVQTNALRVLSQVRDLRLLLLKQNPQLPLLLRQKLPKRKHLLLKHPKQKKNLLNNPKQQNGEVIDFTVFLCSFLSAKKALLPVRNLNTKDSSRHIFYGHCFLSGNLLRTSLFLIAVCVPSSPFPLLCQKVPSFVIFSRKSTVFTLFFYVLFPLPSCQNMIYFWK